MRPFYARANAELGKIDREIAARKVAIRRQPWRLFRNSRYSTEIALLTGWAEGMREAMSE